MEGSRHQDRFNSIIWLSKGLSVTEMERISERWIGVAEISSQSYQIIHIVCCQISVIHDSDLHIKPIFLVLYWLDQEAVLINPVPLSQCHIHHEQFLSRLIEVTITHVLIFFLCSSAHFLCLSIPACVQFSQPCLFLSCFC